MPDKTRMHKIREGPTTITLGALATNTAIIANGPSMVHGGFVTSSEIIAHLASITAGEGNGLMLRIASKRVDAAELEEAIEVNGPVFPKQDPEAHRADRVYRFIGHIGPQGELTPTSTRQTLFRDSYATRLAFDEDSGGWLWFCYNLGAQLTTGGTIKVFAAHNVRWNA